MKKILSALTLSIGVIAGFLSGAIIEGIKQEKRLDEQEEKTNKMQCFYNLLLQWLTLKRDSKNLAEYFEINGYHSIAIYGMRELGEQLLNELEDSNIEVKYIIDKNVSNIECSKMKYSPEEELPQVDVIVVTAIYYFQDIQEELEAKVDYPIVSLEDVVYGLS